MTFDVVVDDEENTDVMSLFDNDNDDDDDDI